MIASLARRPWLAAWLALVLAPLDVLGIAWFRSSDHSNMEKYAYYANGALAGLLLILAVVFLERKVFRRFGPADSVRAAWVVDATVVSVAALVAAIFLLRDTENARVAGPLYFIGGWGMILGLFVLPIFSRRLIRGGQGWALALIAALLVTGITTELLIFHRNFSPNGCFRPRLSQTAC